MSRGVAGLYDRYLAVGTLMICTSACDGCVFFSFCRQYLSGSRCGCALGEMPCFLLLFVLHLLLSKKKSCIIPSAQSNLWSKICQK